MQLREHTSTWRRKTLFLKSHVMQRWDRSHKSKSWRWSYQKKKDGSGHCTTDGMTNNERRSPNHRKCIVEQANGAYCDITTTRVRMSASKFHADRNVNIVWSWKFDERRQQVVPLSLRDGIRYAEDFTRIAGHPGGRHVWHNGKPSFLGQTWRMTSMRR